MKYFSLFARSVLILAMVLYTTGCKKAIQSTGLVKLEVIAVSHQLTKDFNTMQWLKDMENQANVSIEWQQITSDWNTTKPIMLASGDIPDIIFAGVGGGDFVTYKGLFADLTPFIESGAMPNTKKALEETPDLKGMITEADGKIYGLGMYNAGGTPIGSPCFINKEWLDRLDLKMPATWDELKAVLIAFRNNDANGNGDKNDEIPMDFNPLHWIFTPKYLLGSMGLPLSNYGSHYFMEDGKIKNFYFDERFKVLITFLRNLYAENLINKECLTQDYSQYQSITRGNGSYAKVGFTYGSTAGDRFGPDISSQYVSFGPIKYNAASNDPLFYSNDIYSEMYQAGKVSISARGKNIQAAIRFIDLFYDPLWSIQIQWGGMNSVDRCIRDNGDGTYYVLPPEDPKADYMVWQITNAPTGYMPMYLPRSIWDKVTTMEGGKEVSVLTKLWGDSRMIYEDSLKLYNSSNHYPEGFIRYSSGDLQILGIMETDIGSIEQRYAAWLTGEGDIEAEWDSYVQSAIDAGLNKCIEIRQRALEAYMQNLK
jgi:putative aldouronate transport system substrate-binding protein